jgi:hypothetical protein
VAKGTGGASRASGGGGKSTPRVTTSTGKTAPASGQYSAPGGKEITLVKGSTVPPVGGKGATVTLVDPTKNGSGKTS